jgi:hypothetical protein
MQSLHKLYYIVILTLFVISGIYDMFTRNVFKFNNTKQHVSLDAPENQTSTNGSTSGDDIFSSFLSAPPVSGVSVTNGTSTETNSTNNSASKSEEESFFNQPTPMPQEKNKLTKDSILALYGTQPTQPFGGTFSLSFNTFTMDNVLL